MDIEKELRSLGDSLDSAISPNRVPQQRPPATPDVESIADELKKLAALVEEGLITHEDYAAQKDVLLGSGRPSNTSPTPVADQGPPPPNNMSWAIIGLILFWPVGLFALLNASSVESDWVAGHHAEARRKSEQALKLGKMTITITVGLAVLVILVVVFTLFVSAR